MKLNKKIMVVALSASTLALGLNSNVLAAVTGVCSNCHTMHNSQGTAALSGGIDMILTKSVDNSGVVVAGAQGPNSYLIRVNNGCAGCHALGNTNSATAGITPSVTDARGVGSGTLAGGFFTATGADANQHNVLNIASVDGIFANNSVLGSTDDLYIPGNGGLMGKQQIECEDCHAGGGHHANKLKVASAPATGEVLWSAYASTAESYRFLYWDNGGTNAYIKGIEDNDWEFETATDHNTYYGVHVDKGADNTDTDTISVFCASCHEDFHQNNIATDGGAADVSTTASWLRHPTDYAFQTGTEEASYVYQAAVPAGAADPGANPSPAGTNGIVTCLSCHRAHGSDQPDMLRFAYTMDAGNGTDSTAGCFACHTAKDGV